MRTFPAIAGINNDRNGEARKSGDKNRREFLIDTAKEITVFATGFVVLSHLGGCSDKEGDPVGPDPNAAASVQIDLSQAQFSSLNTVGGSVALAISDMAGLPKNGILVSRISDSTFVVLDRTCTHEGCQVGAFGSNGIATCPCHGAQFNTAGNVVRGPAGNALLKYTATLTGNMLAVVLK